MYWTIELYFHCTTLLKCSKLWPTCTIVTSYTLTSNPTTSCWLTSGKYCGGEAGSTVLCLLFSMHKRFASAHGHGLVLIDFGRAVDLKAFSGDVLFQGSCETEGFQCTQMLEGKPWKYEVSACMYMYMYMYM